MSRRAGYEKPVLSRRMIRAVEAVAMVLDTPVERVLPWTGKKREKPVINDALVTVWAAMYDHGMTAYEIAVRFNRTPTAIIKKAPRAHTLMAQGDALIIEAYNLAISMLKDG